MHHFGILGIEASFDKDGHLVWIVHGKAAGKAFICEGATPADAIESARAHIAQRAKTATQQQEDRR
jgi:hypothetical protein